MTRPALIALLITLFILPIVAILMLRPTPVVSPTTTPTTDTPPPPPPPITTTLTTDTTTWETDNTYQVTLALPKITTDVPTVVTAVINYDPAIFTPDTITTGNLWTSFNILTEDIDPEAGAITLTYGQGFEATAGEGTTVAILTFSPTQAVDDTTIILTDASEAYFVSSDISHPLLADPLTLTIE